MSIRIKLENSLYSKKFITNKTLLFIMMGESNSGGEVINTDATATELSARPRVQLWKNLTNDGFEDLHPGTNSLDGHKNEESKALTHHGWDLELANRVYNDDFGVNKTVYLVKTGQGGSMITNWVDNVAYGGIYPWTLWQTRVNGAVSALGGISKVQPYIMLSLGINDAIAFTDPIIFHDKMIALVNNVRTILPDVGFYVTLFPSTRLDQYNISNQLQLLSQELSKFNVFNTHDLAISGNHWLYTDQKKNVDRMTARMFNISDLDTPVVKVLSITTDVGNNAIVHVLCDEDLEESPSSTGISFTPSKTVSSVVRNGSNLKQLDITVSVAFTVGDFITFSYAPGTIKGLSNKNLQRVSYKKVDNSAYINVISATSTLDGNGVYLTFPTAMSTSLGSTRASQFRVTGHTITDVVAVGSASSDTIKLVLSTPIVAGETPFVSYIANQYPIVTATVEGGVNNFSNLPVNNLLNQNYTDIIFNQNAQLTNNAQVYGTTTNGDVAIGNLSSIVPKVIDYRIIIQKGVNYGGGIGLATGTTPSSFGGWRKGLYLPSGGSLVQYVSFGGVTNTAVNISTYQYFAIARISGQLYLQGSNDKLNWTDIFNFSYNTWVGGGDYLNLNVHNTSDKVYYPQKLGF